MPTIGQIFQLAYPEVLRLMRGREPFPHITLNHRYHNGRAALVELPAAEVMFEGLGYPVVQVETPCVWSDLDEAMQRRENQKISFTKALLENAIESHGDIIVDKIGPNRGLIAVNFNWELGGVRTIDHEDGSASYVISMYTLMAVVHNA